MGDVKDLDPDVVQGVLNFIDTNTKVLETLEVTEDVKEGMGVGPSDMGTENVPHKLGSLRLLNKVSIGIWEQCKLITDLSYQMDDVTCGESITMSANGVVQKYVQHMQEGFSNTAPLQRSSEIQSFMWPKKEERYLPWQKNCPIVSQQDSKIMSSEIVLFWKKI